MARKKFLLGMADPSFGFWYTTTTADPQPSISLGGNCQECWIGSTRAEPRTSTLAYRYLATRVHLRSFTNETIEVIGNRLGSNRRVCSEGTAALFKAIRCCTIGEGSRRVGLRAASKTTNIFRCTLNASAGAGDGEGSSGSLQAPRDKTTELWHSDGGGYIRGVF